MIRVTVEDPEAGTKEVWEIEDDYVLFCAGECYAAGFQTHANGTHVVTIKRPKGGGTAKKIEES